MVLADVLVLPLGCILCGILAASSGFLRIFPWFHSVVFFLLPWKIPIGLMTLLAGTLSLFFPADGPPLFGSLFPSVFGIVMGAFQVLDVLLDLPFLRRYRNMLAWMGNALLYVKNPLGLSSFGIGVLHLCFPRTLFF